MNLLEWIIIIALVALLIWVCILFAQALLGPLWSMWFWHGALMLARGMV